jgi:hypothetical protein
MKFWAGLGKKPYPGLTKTVEDELDDVKEPRAGHVGFSAP